jgi:hypothetical protein
MRVRRTPDIEEFRPGKVCFIEIGCTLPGHHILTGFDLVSIENCIMVSYAPCVESGKVIAQYLFDGPWYQ